MAKVTSAKQDLVTIHQLADVMGMTVETLRKYQHRGMPTADKSKRAHLFDVTTCLEWKARTVGETGKHPVPAEKGETTPKDKEFHDIRLKSAQADLAELKYQEQLGRLVSADDALKLFQAEILVMKSKLEQLPLKLAAAVYSETNQKKCQTIIEKEINEALSALSSLYKNPTQLTKEITKANLYKKTDNDDDL